MTISIVPIRSLKNRQGVPGGQLTSGPRQVGLGKRGTRVQKALVLAEAMLAVTLVIGASLLARSVDQLRAVEPGFATEGLIAVDLVAGSEIMDSAQRQQFFDQVTRQAAALPGVTSAGLTNRLALRDNGSQGPIDIEDRPDLADGRQPNSYFRTATPDYFQTLGIQLLAGRTFEARDGVSGPQVAVVSAGFAERIWPDQSAIGKRVRTDVGSDNQLATVIGVVDEVRVTSLVGSNPLVLYRPQAQRSSPGVGNTLILATDLEPTSLIASVRGLVRQLDSRVAVAEVTTMSQVLDAKMAEPLRLRFFLGLFALLGVVLGTVGVYGVVSYGVSRQRRELGVRMALGATPWEVWREVIGKGVAPVALGTLCGIALSLALGRGLQAFLFEVEPYDLTSFVLAAGVLLAAGILAALVPAWRASRVDPSKALRAE